MDSNTIMNQSDPQKAHKEIMSNISIKILLEMKMRIHKNYVPTYVITPTGDVKSIYSNKISARLNEIDRQINEIKHGILLKYDCL